MNLYSKKGLGLPGVAFRCLLSACVVGSVSHVYAVNINNPGFETGFEGWQDADPSAISGEANSGVKSVKVTGVGGRIDQQVSLLAGTNYRLSAYVLGAGRIGVDVGGSTFSAAAGSGEGWQLVSVDFSSAASASADIFAVYDGAAGRFDDFSLVSMGGSPSPETSPCSSVERLSVVAVSDDGTNDGNGPSGVIDGSLAASSRWSSRGNGKWIQFDLGSPVSIQNLRLAWFKGDQRRARFSIDVSNNASAWENILANTESGGGTSGFELVDIADSEARYVRLIGHGNSVSDWNSLIEAELYGCGSGSAPNPDPDPGNSPNLNPGLPPSGNFNLSQWNISVPTDEDGNGKADTIKEVPLSQGYQNADFFYTAADGGMVFKCPVKGFKTSTNTSFTRVELREMLRAGDTSISTKGVNKNNWVFGSAPSSDRSAAGGVDGNQKARLAVNHVTTTGSSSQVGRVIIGQIHANDDEPIRLYYRKLPNNSKGAIYFAHEPRSGSDQYYEMIGRRSSSASNPSDGIALGEVFDYEIDVKGNTLKVTIKREGKADIVRSVSMDGSAYDSGGQYMYFKAGVYNQNNTGNDDDYVQATFYRLEHTHD